MKKKKKKKKKMKTKTKKEQKEKKMIENHKMLSWSASDGYPLCSQNNSSNYDHGGDQDHDNKDAANDEADDVDLGDDNVVNNDDATTILF